MQWRNHLLKKSCFDPALPAVIRVVPMNRRHFLRTGAVSALIAGSGGALHGRERLSPQRAGGGARARNVIFLVSDGMSVGTLSFVDQFIRWRDGRPSHWMRLYEEGIAKRGLMDTASLNSIVTDSAAASSAWGCGQRVNNGSLNIAPNGEEHPTILHLAKDAGKGTGLVTTATVTHATPAGFGANVPSRALQPLIAEQYLARKWDVILGGGDAFFSPEHREDGRDLSREFAGAGYALARNADDLRKVARGESPILGLFAHGNVPYEIDRLNSGSLVKEVPSLKEMSLAALQQLNQNPAGFVVQIEGARIDHGAHANDIAGLVFDQIAFDDAIGAVVDFVDTNPDTLVIITPDHGNANPGLNTGLNGGEENFTVLNGFRGSHGPILSRINRESSPEAIHRVIQEVTGIGISMENADLLRARLQDDFRMPYHRMNGVTAVLGQILANHTDIGWVGHTHTSDHVELAAFGPGSERIKPFQKNTDLFTLMTEALAIPATLG